jgi:hypothetical protein
MAVTLAQAGYLCTDAIKKGIINTLVYNSPFLARLPFITVTGNSYLYNLKSTATSIDFYTTGDTIKESTPIWAQRSVGLCEMIVDADVDKFLAQVRSKDQDLKTAVIEQATLDFKNKFEKTAIMGYTTDESSTKQPKGLMHLVAECESATTTDWDGVNNSQAVPAGSSVTELSLDILDTLVDAIKPAPPDALIMSSRSRRKLNALARASGTNLTVTQDEWGKFIARYNEIPILICDWINDNIPDGSTYVTTIATMDYDKTRASGYDNNAIYAVKFGENGLCGVQNGGIEVEDIGTLETKDATRTRIKWYWALANFSKSSIAVLHNGYSTAL